MKPAEARTGAAAVGGADGDLVRLRSSDRSGGAQSLVDGQQTAVMNGCDEVVVLCLQAHHVRLQIGDTPIEQTNLLEHARVSASKVP
jgi:hypothetical protein